MSTNSDQAVKLHNLAKELAALSSEDRDKVLKLCFTLSDEKPQIHGVRLASEEAIRHYGANIGDSLAFVAACRAVAEVFHTSKTEARAWITDGGVLFTSTCSDDCYDVVAALSKAFNSMCLSEETFVLARVVTL